MSEIFEDGGMEAYRTKAMQVLEGIVRCHSDTARDDKPNFKVYIEKVETAIEDLKAGKFIEFPAITQAAADEIAPGHYRVGPDGYVTILN